MRGSSAKYEFNTYEWILVQTNIFQINIQFQLFIYNLYDVSQIKNVAKTKEN